MPVVVRLEPRKRPALRIDDELLKIAGGRIHRDVHQRADFLAVDGRDIEVTTTVAVLLPSIPSEVRSKTVVTLSVPQAFTLGTLVLKLIYSRYIISPEMEPRIVAQILFPVNICIVDIDSSITSVNSLIRLAHRFYQPV